MNEISSPQRVVVTDVRMPFWSMVQFMVKWAIAAIPAMIILVLVVVASTAFVSGLVASLTHSQRSTTPPPALVPQGAAQSPATLPTAIPAAGAPAPAPTPDQQAYLSKLVVRNVSVGKSVLGEAGAFGEVKNTGDRALKEVEITIFCLGKDGKPVFEKKSHPVLVGSYAIGKSAEPLKPGYSRQFGVKLDDAPSDWSHKVEIRVTGLEFE
jgi:hypothetical protein